MSNQNAGADRKPCKWCSLWQAAYWASRLDVNFYGDDVWISAGALAAHGRHIMSTLALRDPGKCVGCQKARSIQLGTHQTPAETAWRAAQWEQNPTVRWMMRAGEHDTFTEAGRDAGRDHAT